MKVEWECNWEPRKIALVNANLQRLFSQIGGVSNLSELRILPADSDTPVSAAKRITLICKQFIPKEKRVCGTRWTSEFFTPCPECGGRAFVRKEDPQPDPTTTEANASTSASPPAAQSTPAQTPPTPSG